MRLCYVDTSNFRDMPVGGQLTSVRSQLDFIRSQPDISLCLVGIRNSADLLPGSSARRGGMAADWVDDIPFVPVHTDERDPDHPAKSLRLAFMKGLLLNRRVIAALRPDVFFIHCPEAFFPLKLLFPGKPVVTFMHGSFFEIFRHARFSGMKKPWIHVLLNVYLKWTLRHSSGVFVLDEPSLMQSRPLNRNIWKVSNSIDLERFHPGADLGRMRRAVFLGRLSANKQVDRMIEAVSGLPAFSLDIVGEGEEHRHLADLVSRSGCPERIRLLGSLPTSSIPRQLSGYDVLLLNSVQEGMPMVILEAMASGLAIVTTKVGAIGEMLTEGENGLFTDGTSGSLRNALERLSAMDFRKIRENNLKRVRSYSHRSVNRDILDKLMSVVR